MYSRTELSMSVHKPPLYTHVLSFKSRDSSTPYPMIQLVLLYQLVPVAPSGLILVTGTLTLLGP